MSTVIVKKYGNRRLYDTEDSRYVRLDDIATKIRSGVDVRVVDAQTDADLTAETLVQIIFEDRHAARLLPVTLLQQMIRMGDDALAEFLGRYVSFALEVFLQAREAQKNLSPFAAIGPLSALAAMPIRMAAQAGRRVKKKADEVTAAKSASAASHGPVSDVAPAPAADHHDDVATDVASLRRELDELKKTLSRKRR